MVAMVRSESSGGLVGLDFREEMEARFVRPRRTNFMVDNEDSIIKVETGNRYKNVKKIIEKGGIAFPEPNYVKFETDIVD